MAKRGECVLPNISSIAQIDNKNFSIIAEESEVNIVTSEDSEFKIDKIPVTNTKSVHLTKENQILLINNKLSTKIYKNQTDIANLFDEQPQSEYISSILVDETLYIFSDKIFSGKVQENSTISTYTPQNYTASKVIHYQNDSFLVISKDKKKVLLLSTKDSEMTVTEELQSTTDIIDVLIFDTDKICCISEHNIILHKIGESKSFRNTINPKYTINCSNYLPNKNLLIFGTKEGSIIIVKSIYQEDNTFSDSEISYLYNFHECPVVNVFPLTNDRILSIGQNGTLVLWENVVPWWNVPNTVSLLLNTK